MLWSPSQGQAHVLLRIARRKPLAETSGRSLRWLIDNGFLTEDRKLTEKGIFGVKRVERLIELGHMKEES